MFLVCVGMFGGQNATEIAERLLTRLARRFSENVCSAATQRERLPLGKVGQYLLFFFRQSGFAKQRSLFLASQIPEALQFRASKAEMRCVPTVGKSSPALAKSASQNLQFISHLRDFLQQRGFAWSGRATRTKRRNGDDFDRFFSWSFDEFSFDLMHLTPRFIALVQMKTSYFQVFAA